MIPEERSGKEGGPVELRTRIVDTGLLLEEYRSLLETVEQLPLLISGSSMTPFLVHGRDTVYLTRVQRPLRRGDIVLYQRKNGAYILHRIYRVEGDSYSMVGDAQTFIERGIAREQIFAVVAWAERKGRRQAPGSFWWEFFGKLWIRMVPLRPLILRLYRSLRRGRT